MKTTTTVRIDAPVADVWAVLADLAQWPDWTPTMDRVEPGPGELRSGLPVKVVQPFRKPVQYVVDAVRPGRAFSWERRAFGMREWAGHTISPRDGGSEVALTFLLTGPIGRLAGVMMRSKLSRMVDQEAQGLKARAERSAAER